MDKFGCGERTDIASSDALEIAVKAQNNAGGFRLGTHKEDMSGCQPGDPVTINLMIMALSLLQDFLKWPMMKK